MENLYNKFKAMLEANKNTCPYCGAKVTYEKDGKDDYGTCSSCNRVWRIWSNTKEVDFGFDIEHFYAMKHKKALIQKVLDKVREDLEEFDSNDLEANEDFYDRIQKDLNCDMEGLNKIIVKMEG